MNWHHQSWKPAFTNFMVTVCHAIKPAKWSLSTLSTSYSRISTFVDCRIHILNVAEFNRAVLLIQPYKLLSSVKNFLVGQSFFIFFFIFITHPVRLPILKKKPKWDCTITFLCLITCSFFCENSPNLLQLYISSYQYSTSHMIFR